MLSLCKHALTFDLRWPAFVFAVAVQVWLHNPNYLTEAMPFVLKSLKQGRKKFKW